MIASMEAGKTIVCAEFDIWQVVSVKLLGLDHSCLDIGWFFTNMYSIHFPKIMKNFAVAFSNWTVAIIPLSPATVWTRCWFVSCKEKQNTYCTVVLLPMPAKVMFFSNNIIRILNVVLFEQNYSKIKWNKFYLYKTEDVFLNRKVVSLNTNFLWSWFRSWSRTIMVSVS